MDVVFNIGPDRLYKTPPKDYTKTYNIRQKTFVDKDLTYSTRVARIIDFTYDTKYQIWNTTSIHKKVSLLITMYYIEPYTAIILPCLFPCGGPSWGQLYILCVFGSGIWILHGWLAAVSRSVSNISRSNNCRFVGTYCGTPRGAPQGNRLGNIIPQ